MHQDYRRTTVGGCRTAGCPCTVFRDDGDSIPLGSLNDLLIGMHVAVSSIVGNAHGVVVTVDHTVDGPGPQLTTIRLDTGEGNWHEFTGQSRLPITLTIDWPDTP